MLKPSPFCVKTDFKGGINFVEIGKHKYELIISRGNKFKNILVFAVIDFCLTWILWNLGFNVSVEESLDTEKLFQKIIEIESNIKILTIDCRFLNFCQNLKLHIGSNLPKLAENYSNEDFIEFIELLNEGDRPLISNSKLFSVKSVDGWDLL